MKQQQQEPIKNDGDEFKKVVIDLFNKTEKLKAIRARYDTIKSDGVKVIDDYFSANNVKKSASFESISQETIEAVSYKVNKIQKTKVDFIPDMIEAALEKELRQDVILKSYAINDMSGLTTYLKQCNVDPKIFKSFIEVKKTVNVDELERLEEIGMISKDQLVDCYTTTNANPYYTINTKMRQGDRD